MASNNKLTLIYFKMGALAKPPQLLLKYANITCEYKSCESLSKNKQKGFSKCQRVI
jgi:hypothetical protein